ncbi:hypothetical protein Pmar_PMAR007471 [Perkinsus marinus ATCC 50983]|uniref:Uncharacterized protein n=1 Tax=Perkinsus marinus (strain ATCC 50983 / TXsc) TaxID=423536 RepID=C5M044_PERM5|nr:hypothetical protein Pmar_PMAR007471 [Perkinsus marinus ATCC 50983]EEQ97622.1 hypothetical protein Pmar_PMAR007471 [Perkinsus marinus ATCC 50983]|eukprot:XP_002764905.1 hypothetical protein Pmar_PMAR007471 [Perkinsus marinus ATCC 50983]
MGSLDAYAYYEMAITNDERRTAYFADRLSEAGCAMYPDVSTDMRLYKVPRTDENNALERRFPGTCHARLVEMVQQSAQFTYTEAGDEEYGKLVSLIQKQIEIDSRDGSWKALGYQEDPSLYVVENTSVTADVLINNMHASVKSGADKIRIYRRGNDVLPLCSLSIEGEAAVMADSNPSSHTLKLQKNFRIQGLSTPK